MAPFFVSSGSVRGLPRTTVVDRSTEWGEERNALLGRRISELGLQIRGSRVERLIDELYKELAARSISFRPPVYLSDQWGCPDGTPLIGVPFYLVDRATRAARGRNVGRRRGRCRGDALSTPRMRARDQLRVQTL